MYLSRSSSQTSTSSCAISVSLPPPGRSTSYWCCTGISALIFILLCLSKTAIQAIVLAAVQPLQVVVGANAHLLECVLEVHVLQLRQRNYLRAVVVRGVALHTEPHHVPGVIYRVTFTTKVLRVDDMVWVPITPGLATHLTAPLLLACFPEKLVSNALGVILPTLGLPPKSSSLHGTLHIVVSSASLRSRPSLPPATDGA